MLFLKIIFIFLNSFANETLHPGGVFSSNDWSQQAFGHPLSNATPEEKREFGVGNSFFKQAWVEYPSSTVGRDGLGPNYNAVACAACHVLDGRGVAYTNNKVNLSLLFKLSIQDGLNFIPHPEYGSQFQPLSINNVKPEGHVDVLFTFIKGNYPSGESFELRKPKFTFNNLAYSNIDELTFISPRVAPQLIGLGLIEAIDESDILSNSDDLDLNHDGISGHANFVWDFTKQTKALGKFGWKAGQPSLFQQNAMAFINDMGLTSSLFQEQNCTLVELDCQRALKDINPEVSDKVLNRITLYTQLLAVPKSRNSNSLKFIEGQRIFNTINCNLCHIEKFQTSNNHPIEALRNQIIKPYSDFLLHDMGEELADHRPEEEANGLEWRTPPLWSIGLIKTVNNHSNLLHDGRARTIEEAILWHAGESENSQKQFVKLSLKERQNLIYFLENL